MIKNIRLKFQKQNRQRETNRRRAYFSSERRRIIEAEGSTILAEGEGLCSEVPESGTRGQESQYENRPD